MLSAVSATTWERRTRFAASALVRLAPRSNRVNADVTWVLPCPPDRDASSLLFIFFRMLRSLHWAAATGPPPRRWRERERSANGLTARCLPSVAQRNHACYLLDSWKDRSILSLTRSAIHLLTVCFVWSVSLTRGRGCNGSVRVNHACILKLPAKLAGSIVRLSQWERMAR